MLKVLITNFHPEDGGGHTTYIMNLTESQPEDVDIIVASPKLSKLAQFCRSQNRTHISIDFPGKLSELPRIVKNIRSLRRAIKSHTFDIIHVNGSPDHRLVIYALFGLPKPRPKIVATKHNCFPLKKSYFGVFRYRKCTSAIISVCSKVSREMQASLGTEPPRIHTINNGVQTSYFSTKTSPFSKTEWRERLGLPNDGTVFVSCAGAGFHKGWQYLAKDVAERPDVYVVVLGKPPSHARLIDAFGGIIPHNLSLPGMQEDVRPFLWAADVGFVLSTAIETISFACREMMAAGLPVVVNNFGCLPENVDDSSGWVTESRDPPVLASTIDKVLSSKLQLMGKAAEIRAQKLFTIQEFQQRTFEVYRSLS